MAEPASATDVESAALLDHPEHTHSDPPSLQQRIQTALHSPKALNGLEKLLGLLTVFLLLVAATGFGLFAGTAVKLGHKSPTTVTTSVPYTKTVDVPGPTKTAYPPKRPNKSVSLRALGRI